MLYKIVSTDQNIWATGTLEKMTEMAADLKAKMPSRFFFVHPY